MYPQGEEAEYRAVVDNFVSWCELNHLQLNTTKTKELVVDLRRTRTPVTPVSILGHNVDIVEHYKYLGVYTDNKLDWIKNTEVLYKKGQSRLYFLRRLRSFNMPDYAEDVLRVCGGQCYSVCCGVLGQQTESSTCKQTQ